MRIVIENIGTLVSGDPDTPLVEASALSLEDGRIAAVGTVDAATREAAHLVLDVDGMTVIPGLIDSHVHTTFGDYTPRQKTVDFLESYLHGGITSVISASEVHVPGRPGDPAGVKALALAAQRCFQSFRPGGMRVHAGSVIMEPGLVEADFAELAREGVWLAKVGFGDYARAGDAAPQVRAAQKHGFKVMCHTGGASIPGSQPVTADDLLRLGVDIAGHVNGGPIALADGDLERVVHESGMALQIAQAGNIRSAVRTVELAEAAGQFARVLISSDTPTGTGVMPLATIKSVTEMATLARRPAARMIAAATGNPARVYGLDSGLIEVGRAADLAIVDRANGSAAPSALEGIEIGDVPAIAAVVSDGIPRFIGRSRNTPPPTRSVRIVHNRVRHSFVATAPYDLG
jgi:enamidase